MRVAVTGANGFVGQALCRMLQRQGHTVDAWVRRAGACPDGVHEWQVAADDFAALEKARELPRVDAVVHLAARVHVVHDTAPDVLALYRSANVDGTLRVARAAQRLGAKRLVFISSIKALGELDPGRPWREDDTAIPADPYGISKHEAEQQLLALGRSLGLEIAILRPPLVYGPGVRANFLQLLRAVARGLPLPLRCAHARRSLVAVENLVDAIAACLTHPRAVDTLFHVSDGDDLEVATLIRLLGEALGRPARLLPMPIAWLKAVGRMTGRAAQIERLVMPQRLDINRIRTQLGWVPPLTPRQALGRTAAWYKEQPR